MNAAAAPSLSTFVSFCGEKKRKEKVDRRFLRKGRRRGMVEHFLLYFRYPYRLKHLSTHLRDYNSILTAREKDLSNPLRRTAALLF